MQTATDTRTVVSGFKLLGDETRARILGILALGERNVTDLCRELGMAHPAVSASLAPLRLAGVVEARREGKHVVYRIVPAGILAAMAETLREWTGLQSE